MMPYKGEINIPFRTKSSREIMYHLNRSGLLLVSIAEPLDLLNAIADWRNQKL